MLVAIPDGKPFPIQHFCKREYSRVVCHNGYASVTKDVHQDPSRVAMGVKHQTKRGTNNEIKMRFCSKDKVNVETAVFGAAVLFGA